MLPKHRGHNSCCRGQLQWNIAEFCCGNSKFCAADHIQHKISYIKIHTAEYCTFKHHIDILIQSFSTVASYGIGHCIGGSACDIQWQCISGCKQSRLIEYSFRNNSQKTCFGNPDWLCHDIRQLPRQRHCKISVRSMQYYNTNYPMLHRLDQMRKTVSPVELTPWHLVQLYYYWFECYC